MLTGRTPFVLEEETNELFKKIVKGKFILNNSDYVLFEEKSDNFFNFDIISKEAKDFIKQLLSTDPAKRLGYNGINEIKEHEFFKVNNIVFEDVLNVNDKKEKKHVKRPFVPRLNTEDDTRYIDNCFTSLSFSDDFESDDELNNSDYDNNCNNKEDDVFDFSPFIKGLSNDGLNNNSNNKKNKSRNVSQKKNKLNCNENNCSVDFDLNQNATTNYNSQISLDGEKRNSVLFHI